jgi:hypothetical protein
MSDDIMNTVCAVAGDGFVALWRGQKVQSTGGGVHHLRPSETLGAFCSYAMLLRAFRPSKPGDPRLTRDAVSSFRFGQSRARHSAERDDRNRPLSAVAAPSGIEWHSR